MNASAPHDPLLKSLLKDSLESYLYTSVWEEHQTRLRVLIQANSRITHTPYEAFSYKGETYVNGNIKLPRPVTRLDSQLKTEMDVYLQDVKEIHNNEKPYVMGYITQVLNLSSLREDHLALLPEAIHKPILAMKAYSAFNAKTLPPEVINEFMKSNHQSLAQLKKRLMLNLLR